MKALDFFKREIIVGDFVAKASLSHKSAHMVIGKVTSVSEKGNVTIDKGKAEYNWQKRIISYSGNNLVILQPVNLPESFLNLFV
jgi:hypothetical protein